MRRTIPFGIIALTTLMMGCPQDTDPNPVPQARILEADACLVPGCTCGVAEDENTIGPATGEYGHWAAGHIPLPGTPYDVDTVVFGLTGRSGGLGMNTCRPSIPTKVQLFVSTELTPPVSPPVLWEGVPTVQEGDSVSVVELTVNPPVRVEQGQNLFVAFEMAGSPDAHICVYSCKMVGDEVAGTAWWSNAQDPADFNWASLRDFGLDSGYNIGVRGSVAQ